MKLLKQTEARDKKKQENEDLIATNIRLRKLYEDIVHKLNTVKDSYEPDKLKKLEEFERFCDQITAKKSVLLGELKGIENEIEKRKDVYFGFIERQDALEEKAHEVRKRETNVEMRENFVKEVERQQLVT